MAPPVLACPRRWDQLHQTWKTADPSVEVVAFSLGGLIEKKCFFAGILWLRCFVHLGTVLIFSLGGGGKRWKHMEKGEIEL